MLGLTGADVNYPTHHIAKFDANGKPTGFWAIDDDMTQEKYNALIAEGAVVITATEWGTYLDTAGGENGTGYIRDPETGKPVSAPPYVPTAEEIAEAEREAAHAEITIETVEEALCAMDESIEEIKDALCEIDAKLEGGN